MITQQGGAVKANVTFCLNDKCFPTWLEATPTHKPFHNMIWVQEGDRPIVTQSLAKSSWTLETIPPLNELR
jgi:hypothetical protein